MYVNEGHQCFHGRFGADANGITKWGRLVELASDSLVGIGATVLYVEINAGQRNPVHFHENCSEVLSLIEGELAHRVGDETVQLAAGDVLIVPAGMIHGAINTGSVTARMIVAYDAGDRMFEVVE